MVDSSKENIPTNSIQNNFDGELIDGELIDGEN